MPGFDPAVFAQRKVAARGIDIHCVEGGSGAPVLLVAGWPQSWYAWRHVMPLLADNHRVIAIDPPGLGDSGRPRAYDTASVADCFSALLDALALDRVDFVGHDIGAWLGYA